MPRGGTMIPAPWRRDLPSVLLGALARPRAPTRVTWSGGLAFVAGDPDVSGTEMAGLGGCWWRCRGGPRRVQGFRLRLRCPVPPGSSVAAGVGSGCSRAERPPWGFRPSVTAPGTRWASPVIAKRDHSPHEPGWPSCPEVVTETLLHSCEPEARGGSLSQPPGVGKLGQMAEEREGQSLWAQARAGAKALSRHSLRWEGLGGGTHQAAGGRACGVDVDVGGCGAHGRRQGPCWKQVRSGHEAGRG